MRRLRDPKSGCPWDVEQTFSTIAPYTIEEAYEVAGAIEDGDWHALKDELGDLLLQVVFHSRMAEERELFAFHDVVAAIVDKMTRRHPHVFGGVTGIDSADAQSVAWEDHKKREWAERADGLLDDVPVALPALLRAVKLQKRASTVGFDCDSRRRWSKRSPKKPTKSSRRRQPVRRQKNSRKSWAICCSRSPTWRGISKSTPKSALRVANAKFIRRFRIIEETLAARGSSLEKASLVEMEAIWQSAKREKSSLPRRTREGSARSTNLQP